MKRSLLFLLALFCVGLLIRAQDFPGSSDHLLFPRMKGFTIVEYDVTEPATYRFVDKDGTEMIVSGRMLYYYYESDTDMAPSKILDAVSAKARSLTDRFCNHDGDKICMIIQQENVEVWADLSAGDFYYTLRIIERAEVDQEVTAESISADLDGKGETVLYIRFSYRGDEIQPYSLPAIEALAALLKATPALKIEIEGHTDSEGADLENRKISLDRATAVAAELVKAGIDRERLTCTGLGESAPIADIESAEGKALNRRIVISKK
ncbi:MAG: OmpA family protein [Bacteroidales bacterium]|jgi:outer membrane protein OmpA-like peptidoglycan-associated protein|nr:OmpA family protein [Bacteroidales bacterium]